MFIYTVAAYLILILEVIFSYVCIIVLVKCDNALIKLSSLYLCVVNGFNYIFKLGKDVYNAPSTDAISSFLYKLVNGLSVAGDPCITYLKCCFGVGAVFFIIIVLALIFHSFD